MISLKIVDNDIVFNDQNELELISGPEEQAQSIERILSTNVSEFFLNADFGFNYALLQQKNVPENYIRLGLIEAITQDARVKTVQDLKIAVNNATRSATIQFKVLLIDGNTVESEVVV